jgi:hypothetical protein
MTTGQVIMQPWTDMRTAEFECGDLGECKSVFDLPEGIHILTRERKGLYYSEAALGCARGVQAPSTAISRQIVADDGSRALINAMNKNKGLVSGRGWGKP